jgi:hypothetical protein
MKNILLVEPAYNNPYPPLGLLKISTWHKRKGDRVQLIKDTLHNELIEDFLDKEKCYKKLERQYDIIYITSLFTYQAYYVIDSIRYFKNKFANARIRVGGIMATLMPEYIKQKTGIRPHIGLLRGAENCPPDYSLDPRLPYSLSFTTRGCPRNCSFCAVKKHEPKFTVKENWPQDIDVTKRKIIFWDNNWLASPNFEKDVKKLIKFRKAGVTDIDFNQGLDCRLLSEDKVKLLSQIKIKPLRLAFDNCSEEGYIQEGIRLAQKHGFKDIRVYVLYNCQDDNDTPEYFYYRIDEINRLGALSYPMRFRSLTSANGQHVSKNWDTKLLRALKLTLMFYYSKGMIRRSREALRKIYGNDEKQFKRKLYEIYENDKLRNSQRIKQIEIGSLFD